MKAPSEKQAYEKIPELLAKLTGIPLENVEFDSELEGDRADIVAYADSYIFVVEWKGQATAAHVAQAAKQVRNHAKTLGSKAIPIVAVPFMGDVGRERCARAGVSWMDLSGNAFIDAKSLRIIISGQPNIFNRRGRPSSVFAPKSSRIARYLLEHPHDILFQRQIADATEMDEGYTSRIVNRLIKERYIERIPLDSDGFSDGVGYGGGSGSGSGYSHGVGYGDGRGIGRWAVRIIDPDILLDAWKEKYRFGNHTLIRGHVSARSGDELLHRVAEFFNGKQMKYAATGLGAAWLLSGFAGFRIATFFLDKEPDMDLLSELGFRLEDRGANLWFTLPNDEGVFQGEKTVNKVRCVHPVQAYLDLSGHPERAEEAAAKLREEYLSWRIDGKEAGASS